jgi:hypothetical protein
MQTLCNQGNILETFLAAAREGSIGFTRCHGLGFNSPRLIAHGALKFLKQSNPFNQLLLKPQFYLHEPAFLAYRAKLTCCFGWPQGNYFQSALRLLGKEPCSVTV